MIIRAIDINGDWLLGKGRNDYKKDTAAVEQLIKTKLFSFIGDCFFSLEEGVDWFTFMGNDLTGELRLAVATRILNIPEVLKLNELSVIKNSSRRVEIKYQVETIYGLLESELAREL